MNNSIIKSNRLKNITRNRNFDIFNFNKLFSFKNKNQNLNSINYNFETKNSIENLKLNLSDKQGVSKSLINIHPIKNTSKIIPNENKNKNNANINEYKNKNKKSLKRKGDFGLNSSSYGIYSLIPNKNNIKSKQNLLSGQNPQKIISNLITLDYNVKTIKNENNYSNSFNINEFLTKDIKDENIKRKLLILMNENHIKMKNNLIDKNKLKEIHNFPTIFLEEEKLIRQQTNNNYNIISKNKINKSNAIKNPKTERLIMPYLSRNKKICLKKIH